MKSCISDIHCAFDKIVPLADLKPNPRNPNQHPDNQIELLAKIIQEQGWRVPITVSKRSGFIVRGHGRLMAAIRAGFSEAPVDYQDYSSDETELADLLADNRVAELAELNISGVTEILKELNIEKFDMDLTGWEEAALLPLLNDDLVVSPSGEWKGMPEFEQEDKTAFRDLIIHFRNAEDVAKFARANNFKLTDKTKFTWYPEEEIDHVAHKRYRDES